VVVDSEGNHSETEGVKRIPVRNRFLLRLPPATAVSFTVGFFLGPLMGLLAGLGTIWFLANFIGVINVKGVAAGSWSIGCDVCWRDRVLFSRLYPDNILGAFRDSNEEEIGLQLILASRGCASFPPLWFFLCFGFGRPHENEILSWIGQQVLASSVLCKKQNLCRWPARGTIRVSCGGSLMLPIYDLLHDDRLVGTVFVERFPPWDAFLFADGIELELNGGKTNIISVNVGSTGKQQIGELKCTVGRSLGAISFREGQNVTIRVVEGCLRLEPCNGAVSSGFVEYAALQGRLDFRLSGGAGDDVVYCCAKVLCAFVLSHRRFEMG